MRDPQYYTRFQINPTLRRLDTPADPLYQYLKAWYHAVTSFVLPDPLTGRTGSEESLNLLTGATSQPWSRLHSFALDVLDWFAL